MRGDGGGRGFEVVGGPEFGLLLRGGVIAVIRRGEGGKVTLVRVTVTV